MDFEKEVKLFGEYSAKIYTNNGVCSHIYTVDICKNGERIWSSNGCKKLSYGTDYPYEFCENYTLEKLERDLKKL